MSQRVGALFAGYGGLDLAVADALGAEVAWWAEFDADPARIMAHHHPDAPNVGDVTKARWSDLPPVDVITGGSPCQDLSPAGKRAGMRAGTRSGLWVSMLEAIDHFRPRVVVWENVRGALSAAADSQMEQCPGCVGDGEHGKPVLRALGRVLGDLAGLGYDAGWTVVPASGVGAPHRRERVFVVGVPAVADPGRVGPQVPTIGQQPTVPVTRGHGPARGTTGLTLLPTPTASDAASSGMGTGVTLTDAVQRGRTPWGQYAAAIARWELLTRPAPAPTEAGPNGPRLSPAFVEWMMGLPAGWVTDPAIWHGMKATTARRAQLKALGNGVVPQQAAAAIRYLLPALLEAAA